MAEDSILEVNIDLSSLKSLEIDMDRVPLASRTGLERVALHGRSTAIRRVGRISKEPIPTRAQANAYNRKSWKTRNGQKVKFNRNKIGGQGEPLWKRTGNLLRAVEAPVVWTGELEVMMRVDLPYGNARHDLGTPLWIPKKPALGIIRRNDFFNETATMIEPQVEKLFIDGYNTVIRIK